MSQSNELSISFCPTGMIPTKEMTPHVPVTVNEIIEDVHRAVEIGITMVHLHARDEKTGVPTYKGELYERMLGGIRKFSKDLIICVTTSGRDFPEFEQRSEVLDLKGDLKPDMGSLTLSSLNFNKTASMNSPDMIKNLATKMKQNGIVAELEAFDSGMINYAKYLESKNILEAPHYINLLLGNIACAQSDLLHAGMMVRDLPPKTYWGFAGIGLTQNMMNSLAIASGGGVRVGLEDNIWYDQKRTKLATNSDLLRRIHVQAEANDREIMSSSTMRSLLKLNPGNGSYGRNFS
jgi:3-keto-5-aminohexanoate cleavage enzyme